MHVDVQDAEYLPPASLMARQINCIRQITTTKTAELFPEIRGGRSAAASPVARGVRRSRLSSPGHGRMAGGRKNAHPPSGEPGTWSAPAERQRRRRFGAREGVMSPTVRGAPRRCRAALATAVQVWPVPCARRRRFAGPPMIVRQSLRGAVLPGATGCGTSSAVGVTRGARSSKRTLPD